MVARPAAAPAAPSGTPSASDFPALPAPQPQPLQRTESSLEKKRRKNRKRRQAHCALRQRKPLRGRFKGIVIHHGAIIMQGSGQGKAMFALCSCQADNLPPGPWRRRIGQKNDGSGWPQMPAG